MHLSERREIVIPSSVISTRRVFAVRQHGEFFHRPRLVAVNVKRSRAALGHALLLLLLSLAACGRTGNSGQPQSSATPRATRGYIVISIDTLRADHLGCYGYGPPTSPFLDELAGRATLFVDAYAQYPSTLVSHASMFTGLYPREHSVLGNESVLGDGVETFPEVFQRAGFRTGGFTEGGYVSGHFGFRRGFEQFQARDRSHAREIRHTFERGVRFLAGLRPGERFLLFLHTYAVHAPYDAPEEYQHMFWPGEPPPGWFFPGARALAEREAAQVDLSPELLRWLVARYDAGIRETDDVLRGFFAELDRLGLAGDTTVVITADHGEEFLEHGGLQHAQVYREVLRVPLLVVHPDVRRAVRQPQVIELVDLAPTLYALARLRPRQVSSGLSFAAFVGAGDLTPGGRALADGPDGSRALYRAEAGALRSVLLFGGAADGWAARRLALDVPGPALAFEARAMRPQTLDIATPGGAPLAVPLGEAWRRVVVPLPADGARVRLAVRECDPDPAPGRDMRCRGFALRGISPRRYELYDLATDPAQRADLARSDPRLLRTLLRELLAAHFTPRRGAQKAPLDAEALAHLRALGYVH